MIGVVLDNFGLKLRIDEELYQLKYKIEKDSIYIRAFNYFQYILGNWLNLLQEIYLINIL